jgi:predicted dehydrogenase
MALDLTAEQKALGRDNFDRTVDGLTRRGFIKGALAAGAAGALAGAGAYFGYKKIQGEPLRVGLIGAGDEGGVLVGAHNPDYLHFIAYSDIRPFNQKRIFTGEPTGPRLGFNKIYGNKAKEIQFHERYQDLLANPRVEAVVIALPLHLHAPVAIEAMKAGKHVLCEKLMAWNIQQCKEMNKVADETNRVLAIGHQRHYSLLYAYATDVIRSGILGDIKYIRALWHRNNSWPRFDKDGKPVMDPETGKQAIRDSWHPEIKAEDVAALQNRLETFGYKSMEHLVRWRLFNVTGSGLMAELGSHQLDACSIFLGKVHPLYVSGFGGKLFYRDDRDVDDSVFCTFEFPGKKHNTDKDDMVVVTYSSINTNQFEPYGETVMGGRGTLVVEMEQNAMLYPERDPNKPAGGAPRTSAVTVTSGPAGQPALDSGPSGAPVERKDDKAVAGPGGTISRGYREELEHWAYCVREHQKAEKSGDKALMLRWRLTPKCHGRVAMADAVIALTSNIAMKKQERIKYQPAWFDAAQALPEDLKNEVRHLHEKSSDGFAYDERWFETHSDEVPDPDREPSPPPV